MMFQQLDSGDDVCSGFQKRHHKQSFSGLHSPWRLYLPTYDTTPGYKTIYQGSVRLLSIKYNYVGILSTGPKTNAIIIVLVKI